MLLGKLTTRQWTCTSCLEGWATQSGTQKLQTISYALVLVIVLEHHKVHYVLGLACWDPS